MPSDLEILAVQRAYHAVARYVQTFYPENSVFRPQEEGGILEATCANFLLDRADRPDLWLMRLSDPLKHAHDISFWYGTPPENFFGLISAHIRDLADSFDVPVPVASPHLPDCEIGNTLLLTDRADYPEHATQCPICLGQLEHALYREYIAIVLEYVWDIEMRSDPVALEASRAVYDQAVVSDDLAMLERMEAPIRAIAEEHQQIVTAPLPSEFVLEFLAIRTSLLLRQGGTIPAAF